jgi:phosphoribosylamine-glycine ligase
VVDVCATGASLREALVRAYGAAQLVDWPSKVYRRDIGRAVVEAGGA